MSEEQSSESPTPSEFMEFEEHEFPVTIEAFNTSGEVVWSTTADSPGGLVIPGLREEHGPVGVRVWTNGTLNEQIEPPTPEQIEAYRERYGE